MCILCRWESVIYDGWMRSILLECLKNNKAQNQFNNVTDQKINEHIISLEPWIYRVSQEECAILQESVPYVKLYRYNPKHLYQKLNGYGDNGQRKVWTSCISAYCTSTAVSPLTLKPHLPVDTWLREARTLAISRRTSPAHRDKIAFL